MAKRPMVLGYYLADSAMTPDKIDYRLFTHINQAFAKVGPDGSIRPPDAAKSRDLCARAHRAGVKVILSVGGAESGPGYAVATATPAKLAQMADRLAAIVAQIGYDGVDVDWEFPTTPAECDQMNALVAALRSRLPQATLSMATSATDWGGKWFHPKALLPYLDFANVMTYDFHGPWSDHSGYNSPLFTSPSDPNPACRGNTVSASVDYWLKTKAWPRERLLLGLPLYGHGFRASAWGAPTKGSYAHSDVVYNDVESLRKQGWKRSFDEAAHVPFLTNPAGTELISYDDATSLKDKASYGRERGLGGIFFWEISQDFDGHSNPLVRAARSGFAL